MEKGAILEHIKASRLGKNLGTDIINGLVGMAQAIEFEDGQAVVTAGDERDDMYLLVEGQARVDNTFAGQTRSVAMLKTGDFFGEVGLLGGGKRSSSVIAQGAITCLMFPADNMRDLFAQFPAMKLMLEQAGTQRQTTNLELHIGEVDDD